MQLGRSVLKNQYISETRERENDSFSTFSLGNHPEENSYTVFVFITFSKSRLFRYAKSNRSALERSTYGGLNCGATGRFWSSYATATACLTKFKIALSHIISHGERSTWPIRREEKRDSNDDSTRRNRSRRFRRNRPISFVLKRTTLCEHGRGEREQAASNHF